MGKEIDKSVGLRGRCRRIEKPGSNQVIEGYWIASIRVVKLPSRVGTLSVGRISNRSIEGAGIDGAGAVFSEVPRALQIARNDRQVVRPGLRVRVALIVDEEKGAVFQVDKFRDIDRTSQSATEKVEAIAVLGEEPLRPVDRNQCIQGIVFEEIVDFPMEIVSPGFGGCTEVRKVTAIFGGKIRNADFHLANGFRGGLEAAATFIVIVRVDAVHIVSIVPGT